MVEPIVCRPRGSVWLCVAVWVIVAVGLVSLGVQGAVVDTVRFAPAFLLAAWCAWMVFGAPSVVIGANALLLVNLVRTVRIPWGAIDDVEAGLSLRVRTPAGTHSAWAAPGGSATAPSAALGSGQLLGGGGLGMTSAGSLQFLRGQDRAQMDALLGFDRSSQTTAVGIRTAILQAWRAFGAVAALTDEPAEVTVRWHRGALVVLAVLVVLTAAGVAA